MPSTSFHAMGSKISVVADGDNADVRAMLWEVRGWFLAWEVCLSRFRPESELSQLNRRAGQPVAVSETLWNVLNAALEAARQTDGLITPTILPDLEAAGYDKDFKELDTDERGKEQTSQVLKTCEVSDIQLNPATRTVHLPEGMRLDLGGFAKGWAADEAARRLRTIAPSLVDAGGDIAVSGPRADGSAWPVGVADPQNPGQNLTVVQLSRGGLSTSGRNYRRWVKDGRAQHHLIDPRHGQPAQTDILTASVRAPSALEAEIAAKMALILGSRLGGKWLRTHQLAGILVLEDGRVLLPRPGDDVRDRRAGGDVGSKNAIG
jgi:thiamine biosynthesis lipoprotein